MTANARHRLRGERIVGRKQLKRIDFRCFLFAT
jgi:hypothetical protein